MSVTPQTLPNVDSTSSDTAYVYQYRTTSGDFHIYSQYSVSTGALRSEGENSHDIKVGINTGDTSTYNIWADAGSLNPSTLTLTNGIVYCYQSSGYLAYAFTKPTSASWISSGSGTETEGSTSPSGSTYINSQGQIVFVITASSPSSDGNIIYKIYRRPIGSAFEQAYVVPHTSGSSDTEWTIGLNYSLYDRWELRVESSTALVQSATLAVYTTVKKVFRNFW